MSLSIVSLESLSNTREIVGGSIALIDMGSHILSLGRAIAEYATTDILPYRISCCLHALDFI